MLIAGHTEDSVRLALDRLNLTHEGNLDFKKLERHGKTGKSKYLDVRLTVKRNRDGDGRVLPGVATRNDFRRGSKDGLIADYKASWDAHGEFMAELYRINPETVIRAGSIANGGVVLKSRDDLYYHWR